MSLLPKSNTELESSVEKKVVAWAKRNDYLCRKMNGMGYNGWPDRLLISKSGTIIWVELKRTTGKLSELQERLIDTLRNYGQNVIIAYGYEDFLKQMEAL